MTLIKAKQPGNAIPRVDKWEVESILYTIDVTDLIQHPNEMANGIVEVRSTLEILDAKTRSGKFIELRVPPNAVGSAQYKDYRVDILFKTSSENVRSATFTVRVYR